MNQTLTVRKSAAHEQAELECSHHGMTRIATWVLQVGVAVILGQTLFFKFTYAPETQLIFAKLGGRPAATMTGIVELVCAVLLLMPRRAIWGAALALFTILGAIVTHLTILGIVIVDPVTGKGDGGLLFVMALAVAFGSIAILWLRRDELRRALVSTNGCP